MTDHDTTPPALRWALYARGATRNHVQVQLAELRGYVEEKAGTVVAECSDVGGIASGRAALLALLTARAADRVLVVDLPRLSRQNQDLAQVSALLEQAAAELFVLEDPRQGRRGRADRPGGADPGGVRRPGRGGRSGLRAGDGTVVVLRRRAVDSAADHAGGPGPPRRG
jgi:hypothetical protein